MSTKAGHLAVCQLLIEAGANTTYETVGDMGRSAEK